MSTKKDKSVFFGQGGGDVRGPVLFGMTGTSYIYGKVAHPQMVYSVLCLRMYKKAETKQPPLYILF
ncbi:MAG: hypothetical protein PHC95_16035 [Parabacteroides sp.]|nr:hypothetical protein [Parabacteroides sp.]